MIKRMPALLAAFLLLICVGLSANMADATVSGQNSSITAQGNGAATVFTYNFLIPAYSPTPVVVSILDTTVTPNVTTVLTSGQYTITGINNPAGGTVIYPLTGPPLISGQYITISRSVPYTQTVAFANQGTFYPKTIETGLDQLEFQIQQLNTDIGSTASGGLAGGDLGGSYPNPQVLNLSHVTNSSLPNSGLVNPCDTIGGQTLCLGGSASVRGNAGSIQLATGAFTSGHCGQFDTNGNLTDSGAACGGSSSGTITAGPQYYLPYYSLSGSNNTLSALASLGSAGQVLTSQGAGNPPHWTSSSACTAGGANCVGWFNVVSYGADPTGSGDSTSAISSAVSAACAAITGGNVYFPAGTYKYSSITLNCNGVYLVGDNIQTTNLQVTTGSGDAILIGSTTSSSVVLDTGIMNMQLSASGARSSGYIVHVANVQGSTLENLFVYTPAHSYAYSGVGVDCYNILAGCYTHKLTNVQVAGTQHNGIGIGENSTSGPPSDIFLTNINIGTAASTGLAIDWVSGLYGTSVEAGGGTYGVGFFPGTGKWVFDAWFDKSQGDANSAYGWYFSGAGYYADIHLFNGWGSSNTANGLYVDTSATNLTGLQIVGGSYTYNGQFGILVNAGKNVTIDGVHAGSNSQASSGTYSGIAFGSTATQFTVTNSVSGIVGYPCLASGSCPGSPSQQYGILINSGSNNNYILQDNVLLNNVTAGLQDAGGSTKFICNNLGTSTTANCGGSGGSGTVNNCANSGYLAYYATSGTAVSCTTNPTVATLTATGVSNIALQMYSGQGLYCSSGCGTQPQNLIYGGSSGVTWLGSPTSVGGGVIVAQNTFEPSAANALNLGGSGDNWQQLYVNVASIATSATINSNPVLSGSGIVSGDCAQFSGTAGVVVPASGVCGTISGVTAGNQLTGGGSSGTVTLNVSSTPSFSSVATNTVTNSVGHTILNEVSDAGAVFIGNATTSNPVSSIGDFLPNQNNTYHLGNTSFKWIDVWAVNGTIQTSDKRAKHDFASEDLGLDFIRSLKPTVFSLNEDAKEARHHGFIAQEVETALGDHAFAGLYKPVDPNQMYGLNYAEFVAPLTRGEQQLAVQADQTSAQVRDLQNKVDQLSNELAGIRALLINNVGAPATVH